MIEPDNENFKIEFFKRFDSFRGSTPVEMVYDVHTISVDIHIRQLVDGKICYETFTYHFDFNKNVKENIYDIKQILIDKYYPRLSRVVTIQKDVSASDKAKMITSGKLSVSEALDYTEEYKLLEEYTIIRVLSSQNVIHLLKDDELYECQLVMPLYFFRQYLTPNLAKANQMFRDSVDYIKLLPKRGA